MRFSFIVSLMVISAIVYYLLLSDNILHASIPSVLHWGHGMASHTHFFVTGFLPIYISLVVFGAATLVFHLFTKFSQLLTCLFLEKETD